MNVFLQVATDAEAEAVMSAAWAEHYDRFVATEWPAYVAACLLDPSKCPAPYLASGTPSPSTGMPIDFHCPTGQWIWRTRGPVGMLYLPNASASGGVIVSAAVRGASQVARMSQASVGVLSESGLADASVLSNEVGFDGDENAARRGRAHAGLPVDESTKPRGNLVSITRGNIKPNVNALAAPYKETVEAWIASQSDPTAEPVSAASSEAVRVKPGNRRK